MNTNSLICYYIYSHPDTWEEDIKNKNIEIKRDENGYVLFMYFINADFYDPIVCEARGIIIDIDSLDVVCVAFNKFFNQHEPYAADINWDNCKIYNKYDGSIVKLWFDKKKNEWNWSTNSVINAENASIDDFKHTDFLDLIKDAINYNDINYEKLDKNNTYIFEIVDPILHPVKYPDVKLYHIGTRNNITLIESNDYIGIEKPEEYNLHSLEETIEFVSNMNQNDVTQEGVVVVDNNWNRIKIKNLTYLQLHYLNSGIITNKVKILKLIHLDDIDIDYLITKFPIYKDVFNFYIQQEKNLYLDVLEVINNARNLSKTKTRKEIVDILKDNPLRYFAFKYLDSNKGAKELLEEYRNKNISGYSNLISDYET